MKPIIRWTIGNATRNSSYEILKESIKSVKKLYLNKFKYFVFYNDVDIEKINKIKNKFNDIEFIKQTWSDCPVSLDKPVVIEKKTQQKLNGSFWKICPPRVEINNHEIVLDNDLIFLKKPKIIEEFLSKDKKNLIIQDSKIYLGEFQSLFENEKQGYNSGLYGLRPGYDFEKDIINCFNLLVNKKNLSYGQEQGLLMYVLFNTNPLIGSSEAFVGIHAKKIYLNSLSNSFSEYREEKIKDINKKNYIEVNESIVKKIFTEAEVVHFLESNRVDTHKAWNYYKKLKYF